MKILSVIVPIYNVELYLKRCIDSIVAQSYKNLEIILVNDGSTDKCGVICDYYASLDKRIKVIHKVNGGLSSARNVGLENMTGYYCAFVDSDDWIDAEMYSTMIEALEYYDADISSCSVKEVHPYFVYTPEFKGLIKILKKEKIINSLLNNSGVRFEVWNKVFKSSLIGDIRFKEKQVYEDIYFDRCLFLKEVTLVHLDTPFYNYLKVRPGNTNSLFNINRLVVFEELTDFIELLNEKKLVDSSQRFENFLLETSISIYWDANRLRSSKEIKKSILYFFNNYKSRFKDNPYVNQFKIGFFKLFPNLYINLMRVKYLFYKIS